MDLAISVHETGFWLSPLSLLGVTEIILALAISELLESEFSSYHSPPQTQRAVKQSSGFPSYHQQCDVNYFEIRRDW